MIIYMIAGVSSFSKTSLISTVALGTAYSPRYRVQAICTVSLNSSRTVAAGIRCFRKDCTSRSYRSSRTNSTSFDSSEHCLVVSEDMADILNAKRVAALRRIGTFS